MTQNDQPTQDLQILDEQGRIGDNEASFEAVADFLEALGHEDLNIAATPHRKLLVALRERAELIRSDRAAVAVLVIVDKAAEALYNSFDVDLLTDASTSWEDFTEEERRSWRVSAAESLRSVGAIEITDEQIDRLLGAAVDGRPWAQPEEVDPEPETTADADEEADSTNTDEEPVVAPSSAETKSEGPVGDPTGPIPIPAAPVAAPAEQPVAAAQPSTPAPAFSEAPPWEPGQGVAPTPINDPYA